MKRDGKLTMKEYVRAGSPSTRNWDTLFVSVFNGVCASSPNDRRLIDVLNDIRNGKHAQQIAQIRETYSRVKGNAKSNQEAKGAIGAQKKRLPAFCISGTASDRKTPLIHSGLLQIDLDALGETLSKFRDRIMYDPYVAFGFVSPSGDGLKLGIRIEATQHKESFNAANAYFKRQYDAKIDPACKDRLRLCFVSHDPDLWINENAVPLPTTNNTPPDIRLSPESASSILHPASCITTESILGLINDQRKAMAVLKTRGPALPRLYELLIESRFKPMAGSRNDFLVQAVPFLYRAVAPHLVLELVGCFHSCHHTLFKDSYAQHMKEAKAMLKLVADKYPESLADNERQIYLALDQSDQSAFRICRDLSQLSEPKRDPHSFYLSFNHLADRLGIFPTQAQRILRRFEQYLVLELRKKGTRRAQGAKGEAGTYHWRLLPSDFRSPTP